MTYAERIAEVLYAHPTLALLDADDCQHIAEQIAQRLGLDDGAARRGALALCEYGVLTVDCQVATWEHHHRKLTQMAQIVLNAATWPAEATESQTD